MSDVDTYKRLEKATKHAIDISEAAGNWSSETKILAKIEYNKAQIEIQKLQAMYEIRDILQKLAELAAR